MPQSTDYGTDNLMLFTRFRLRSGLQCALTDSVKQTQREVWRDYQYRCPTGIKKSRQTSAFFVPRIGLEPTCREALAPETSVSTISPPGHRFVRQRYYFFLFRNTFPMFFFARIAASNLAYLYRSIFQLFAE